MKERKFSRHGSACIYFSFSLLKRKTTPFGDYSVFLLVHCTTLYLLLSLTIAVSQGNRRLFCVSKKHTERTFLLSVPKLLLA